MSRGEINTTPDLAAITDQLDDQLENKVTRFESSEIS